MHSTEKRLNEMNRLEDMLHFPAVVNAGATANVMVTVLATWWVQPRYPAWVGVWVGLVLVVNLAPVILLRLTMPPTTVYPLLPKMNFIHDQHKFADWVYLAASANMTFWILLTWTVSATGHGHAELVCVEVAAFLATFSPVLLRGFTGSAR